MSNLNCFTLRSLAVTITATEIQITVDKKGLVDGCKYRIYVEQLIPQTALGLPVTIVVDGANTPLWTCGGARPVFALQLRNMVVNGACGDVDICIPVEYVATTVASNPKHFTVTRRLCPMPII